MTFNQRVVCGGQQQQQMGGTTTGACKLTSCSLLTAALHHFVELGLDVELWVSRLDAFQFDGDFLPRRNVRSCTRKSKKKNHTHSHQQTFCLQII